MPTSPERRCPPGAHKLAGVPESSRGPRRFLAATGVVALAGGLATGLAGCAKFDAALGQQWATVNFNANTPVTTILQVRTACSHIPNVRAEALPPFDARDRQVIAPDNGKTQVRAERFRNRADDGPSRHSRVGDGYRWSAGNHAAEIVFDD